MKKIALGVLIGVCVAAGTASAGDTSGGAVVLTRGDVVEVGCAPDSLTLTKGVRTAIYDADLPGYRLIRADGSLGEPLAVTAGHEAPTRLRVLHRLVYRGCS